MERAIALVAAAAAARLSPDQIARAKKSPGERLQAQVVDVEQLLVIAPAGGLCTACRNQLNSTQLNQQANP